jgi:WD40 repeat protein
MSQVSFSTDGTTEFFCLIHDRQVSFYSSEPIMLLSQTRMPFHTPTNLATIADSNIIAVTPRGGSEIQIWDRVKATIYYTIPFSTHIIGIKLRPDVIIAVCDSVVLIHNLASYQPLATIPTAPNPSGAIAVDWSYSSLIIAVPAVDVGVVHFYDCLDPATPIRTFRAFDKPIKEMEFSRNRSLIAVASDSANEVALFSGDSGQKVRSLRLGKRDRVLKVMFDEFTMHLAVQLESRTVYLFQLPIVSRAAPAKLEAVTRDAQYSVPKPFWAFFSGKLFEMNIVTEELLLCRLRYDASEKAFKEFKTLDLRKVPGT